MRSPPGGRSSLAPKARIASHAHALRRERARPRTHAPAVVSPSDLTQLSSPPCVHARWHRRRRGGILPLRRPTLHVSGETAEQPPPLAPHPSPPTLPRAVPPDQRAPPPRPPNKAPVSPQRQQHAPALRRAPSPSSPPPSPPSRPPWRPHHQPGGRGAEMQPAPQTSPWLRGIPGTHSWHFFGQRRRYCYAPQTQRAAAGGRASVDAALPGPVVVALAAIDRQTGGSTKMSAPDAPRATPALSGKIMQLKVRTRARTTSATARGGRSFAAAPSPRRPVRRCPSRTRPGCGRRRGN